MICGTKLKCLQTSHDAALLQDQPHFKKKKKSYKEVFKATNTTISSYGNRHQKSPKRKALHDNKKDQMPLLASHATALVSPFGVTEQQT